MAKNVVYIGGVAAFPSTLSGTFTRLHDDGGVAWLGFVDPTSLELEEVATEFGLHDLAVQDAVQGHQRPKLEEYDGTRFVVLRPARVSDSRLQIGELHLFVGPNFVITVRHDAFPDLVPVRQRLAQNPRLTTTPEEIQYAIVDAVVDSYGPVVTFVRDAIDDVEEDIVTGEDQAPKRVYELLRDVMALQRSVHPLPDIVDQFRHSAATDLDVLLRDVNDRALQISGQVDSFRDVLTSGLQLHSALVGQRQNEEMARMTQAAYNQGEQTKKVSAWAAILFTPTVIAGIYGMNFHHMPELATRYGYPVAVLAMLVAAVSLYIVFKRQRWL